jgi:hypothetical protein
MFASNAVIDFVHDNEEDIIRGNCGGTAPPKIPHGKFKKKIYD